MRIRAATLSARTFPLQQPLLTARAVLTNRTSFFVALHAENGRVGIGEAAPLPGFGTEEAPETQAALEHFCQRKSFPELPRGLAGFDDWTTEAGLDGLRTPAAAFGVQSALLFLIALDAGVELAAFLSPASESQVPVSALLPGVDAVAETCDAVRAGFRTVKLKVGTRSVTEEIEIVRRVRAACPDVVLRLDANGAWTLEEACQFSTGVADLRIEFLEDPLAEPSHDALLALREKCSVPVALDHLVSRVTDALRVMEQRLCDVVVLKPSCLGSYPAVKLASAAAHKRGIGVVVSSLLESGLGLACVAACAAAYGTRGVAQGLGTASLLSADVLDPPVRPQDGMLTVPARDLLQQRLVPGLYHNLQVPMAL